MYKVVLRQIQFSHLLLSGFHLNALPASTALPIAENEMSSITSLHLSGSQGNRLSQVATSMETNLGSSEIDDQAKISFSQQLTFLVKI
ncbi:hypothetical protein L195_g043294 [Trifolium pratense]|uniref:Uncharacterized protein n=1 Tax=Trifolium pratense TaxID=57577 RepID=A0A2K3M8V1_TRIPR|nr:hypothetical protein L195_g043294 [Trifolium pratense]